MIYNIYDKDMYLLSSSVVNSIHFAKCGSFRACHFVAYAKSHFITNLNVIREVHENSQSSRCGICEKLLNRRDNYDHHVRVCRAEFKCLYCGFTLKFLFHRTARLQ